MKTIFRTLTFVSLMSFCFSSWSIDMVNKQRYVPLEKLASEKVFKIKFRSKGGYQGYCMNMFFENKGKDTCFALVEAGRRLESVDTTQQDIFIVKDEYVVVPPKSKKEFALFGFCCISHNKGPKAGSAFLIGHMEGKDWQAIARLINDHDFDKGAIQAAVWAISNNHEVSAISRGQADKNLALLQAVAQIRGVEVPWYNTQYSDLPGQVFSNKPKNIQADIPYSVAYEGVVSVLVRDSYGVVQSTLLDNAGQNKGQYTFYLDLEIAAWKDGEYELVIIQDGNKLLKSKKFEINRTATRH
jgi:hypothetical protein